MPTLARPDVDVLDGLTTAIIVDQERMGANVRSTRRHRHRRQRDAADPLQPARPAAHRLAQGVLLQHPLGHGRRRRSRSSAVAARPMSRTLQRDGRDVSALRGHGHGHRHRPDPALTTRRKSIAEGAITIPGYKVDSWWTVGIFTESGFLDPNKPIRDYQREGAARLPVPGADQGQGQRRQPHLRGADPQDPEVDALARTSTRCSRTSARSSSGRRRSRPVPTAAAPGSARRPGRRRSTGSASPTPARCRSATSPSGCAASTSRRVAPLLANAAAPSTRSWRSGWATSRSTGRRARCRAARRSAPR